MRSEKIRVKGERRLAQVLCVAALLTFCFLTLASCKRDRCESPIGESGAIYLPEYPDIYNSVGGTVVLNKGYRGILVRCSAFGEYMAFECACPQDHDVRMLPDDDHNAVLLTCPSCGSRFEVVSSGSPLEGSSTACPLHQYRADLDGNTLYIY